MLTSSASSNRPRAVYAVIATALVTAATLAVAAPANAQLSFGSFATQGDASAGWINEPSAPPNATDQQSISLFVNGKSANDFSAAARARFVGINGAAPAAPPSFDFKVFTVGGSGGSVRLVVRFADGGQIELRPVSLDANVWTHIDGSSDDWDSAGGACSSQFNLSYSDAVIGDTTNTASRIEGMTKGTPHTIFLADSTRALLTRENGDLEHVDSVDVRGRSAQVVIWTAD